VRASRRGLGPVTSVPLIERLGKLIPTVNRVVGGGPPIVFTREETAKFLETHKTGVSWRAMNEMLPMPYARPHHLAQAVRRSAERLGLQDE
jgi:hypothetical protein